MAAPVYDREGVQVYRGDCLDVLRQLADESVHAVVTDPPYALGFMGKEWDKFGDTGRGARARIERADEVTPTGEGHSTSAGPYLAAGVDSLRSAGKPFERWCEEWARECLRVLKPGGWLLAFGGTRTFHRLACGIEDAGFEIRDSITWIYSQGFPKSLDVSKAIDTAAGVEREVIGLRTGAQAESTGRYGAWGNDDGTGRSEFAETRPATPAAEQWSGWGTALKPAQEPIILARRPSAGTVAANVLAHGTGALNIDGCRVEAAANDYAHPGNANTTAAQAMYEGGRFANRGRQVEPHAAGRWPTNAVFSHAPECGPEDAPGECVPGCPVAELDAQSGTLKSGNRKAGEHGLMGYMGADVAPMPAVVGDTGGASRFFPVFRYQAKAGAHERPVVNGVAHPTVKPLGLMDWLVRLVTPPGGTVLDPFAGSGPTLRAARDQGLSAIGIEREADHIPLIIKRLEGRRRLARPPRATAPEASAAYPDLFDLLNDDEEIA